MSEPLLIYTTWPDAESALAFAESAVGEGLAACANVLAPITSVYRWKGVVERATETPMLLKTTRTRVKELESRFVQAHPYETPAFVAWPLDLSGSHGPFLHWLRQETAGSVLDPVELQ
jgi:periplasmic divalent cation tolerance protein